MFHVSCNELGTPENMISKYNFLILKSSFSYFHISLILPVGLGFVYSVYFSFIIQDTFRTKYSRMD